MGDLKIRSAGPDDYEAYLNLVMQVDRLHAEKASPYYQVPPAPARARDYYLSRLVEPSTILLADRAGVVVGYVHVEAREEPPIPVLVPMPWANVSDLVVDATVHRLGVGKALMGAARAWAKRQGCKELRLSVAAFNTGAMAFYEKEGFVVKHTVLRQSLD